jgi:hypothetical protein
VFSLGAVLAFAAGGAGPFGVGPAAALAFRVVNAAPNLSGVPEQLRPMIERCLAKDPAARPTPGELLAALADGNAAPTWPRRRRGGRIAAAALLAAAATGIALAAAPGTTSATAPKSGVTGRPEVDGVWTGTYHCNQGLTGVQLTISGSAGGAGGVTATIHFYPVAANPGVEDGSYELVGSYSATGGLVLNPDYWIDEPAGYEMVGLSAPPPHANAMSGSVRGVNCSTFSVTR